MKGLKFVLLFDAPHLEKRMDKHILHCVPRARVDCEHALDEILDLLREIVHIFARIAIPAKLDLLKEHTIAALKRKDPGHKNKEHHTQRPHIHRKIIQRAIDHLGRNILICAKARLLPFEMAVRKPRSLAKVAQLECIVGNANSPARPVMLNQNVLRLEIPVHHAVLVHVLERLADLEKHLGSLMLLERPALHKILEQIAAVRDLGHNDQLLRRVKVLHQMDHVGMVELLEQRNLALQRTHHIRIVLPLRLFNHLARKVLARVFVLNQIHLGKRAVAKLLLEHILVLEHSAVEPPRDRGSNRHRPRARARRRGGRGGALLRLVRLRGHRRCCGGNARSTRSRGRIGRVRRVRRGGCRSRSRGIGAVSIIVVVVVVVVAHF
eukprot:comp16769_c0_seq1/m.27259 comp16769_c0_seq1/g.27259  ORF comp16769_c0_seq1/g.27259 comp16769_c0_seq1/m.27259 type:complete len:380 (+) comp16769_c0_seq1:175-1314(+)